MDYSTSKKAARNLLAFIDTTANLKGLHSAAITELKELAPKLSDSERRDVLAELMPLNDKLIESKTTIVKIYRRAKRVFDSIKKIFIPKIRKLYEKREKEKEMEKIEKFFE